MNQNGGSSNLSPISNKNTYCRKRKKTLRRKAEELSILCDVPVCLVCVETNGKVETWPEERHKVDEILQQYMRKTTNASETVLFGVKYRNPSSAGEGMRKYESWSSKLDYLPEDSLVEILEYIERKEKILDERMLREDNDEIRATRVSNP